MGRLISDWTADLSRARSGEAFRSSYEATTSCVGACVHNLTVNVTARNNKTRLIILFGRDEDLVTL